MLLLLDVRRGFLDSHPYADAPSYESDTETPEKKSWEFKPRSGEMASWFCLISGRANGTDMASLSGLG
jgi:hypothetical protein